MTLPDHGCEVSWPSGLFDSRRAFEPAEFFVVCETCGPVGQAQTRDAADAIAIRHWEQRTPFTIYERK